MIYCDLHCDTLTACGGDGDKFFNGNLQISVNSLIKSGCAAQCFAVFTDGERAFDDFKNCLNFYRRIKPKLDDIAVPIVNFDDFKRCVDDNKTGYILTAESLSFLEGDLSRLELLRKENFKMASLVWNYENELARPNLKFKDGLPLFSESESRGLTAAGREVVERLDGMKIIIDLSHLSDGGAEEILSGRKIPAVASHSNSRSAFDCCRNLPDSLIKKIADCGGAVGVNFCLDFLGGDGFENILNHVDAIIKAGGEDCIALGSDFDGIPSHPQIKSCREMPALLNYLCKKLPARVVEKLAYKNFFRVFKEVCG